MRTLIIEAQGASRRVLKQALAELGSCDCVPEAGQGLRQFQTAYAASQPYDLVCVDVSTQGWGGIDVLREMREHEQELGVGVGRQTRMLMTTDIEDVDHIVRHLRRGCHGYLIRPFTVREVQDSVQRILWPDTVQTTDSVAQPAR
ncbi:MAG: response regulator [Planctomycetota bacterium]